MSSFVIAKEEYIKAAGLVAAIADEKKFWIYNYKEGRNFLESDYYDCFVLAYKYNAYSVREQYGIPGEPRPELRILDPLDHLQRVFCV